MPSTTGEIFERMRLQMTNKEEEYLAQLPSGTPISRGVFECGFYFEGGFIKYRTSFWKAIKSFKGFLADIGFTFFFLLGVLSTWAASFGDGNNAFYVFAAILFLIALGEKICYSIQYCLRPPYGFDIENNVFKCGRFFVKVIPFEDINCLHTLKKNYFSNGDGFDTKVYLETESKYFTVMRFHKYDDYLVDQFIDAMRFIVKEDISVKREVRE
jgi:hypothetical protein